MAIALAFLFSGAVPALAYTPAYDSKITGPILGPAGQPAAGMEISVYTEANLPYGQGDQDMRARTITDATGRFSFLADSRTVYKVRAMDGYWLWVGEPEILHICGQMDGGTEYLLTMPPVTHQPRKSNSLPRP